MIPSILSMQIGLTHNGECVERTVLKLRWESDAYLVVVAVFKTAAPAHCAGG